MFSIDSLYLLFHEGEAETAAPSGDQNFIVLSEAFFGQIDHHRIPVEGEVGTALANAPGVLHVHLWLVWKTRFLKGHAVRILLFTPGGLADQLGSTVNSATGSLW